MYLYKKNINTILLTNLVFSFLPISFILGNLAINATSVLFCCLGIFHLRSKIFTTQFNFYIKLIFLLFFIIFFSTSLSFIRSTFYEGYEYIHLVRLAKSIIFFRFLLMLIIIYLLNEFNIINFKYFFLTATFSSLLVSLDVTYQYFFGFNITGFKSHILYNSSFFGDEIVAGSFIQRFSCFSIFCVAYIFNNKNNYRFILTTFTVCILGVGVLLAGNKMPLIIFLFGLLLIFLFRIKFKKIILTSIIFLALIFNSIFSSDKIFENKLTSFFGNAVLVVGKLINTSGNIEKLENLFIEENENLKATWKKTKNDQILIENEAYWRFSPEVLSHDLDYFWVNRFGLRTQAQNTGHRWLYYTALDTWRLHKIFGNGLKSFRIDCDKFMGYPYFKQRLCSSHPHNYYLEILTETGIIGFSLSIVFAAIFLAYLFKNFKSFKGKSFEEYILLSAAISLFMELFPLKSTGSLFSTGSATYIILITSILLCHKKLIKTKNPK